MVTKNLLSCQVFLKHLSIRESLEDTLEGMGIFRGSAPIYRLKNPNKLVYRCSFPFPRPELTDFFWELKPSINPDYPQLEFMLQLSHPNKIDFQLSDRSLGIWVENFPELFFPCDVSPKPMVKCELNLFPLQYIHARCCNLLRLGESSQLIGLKSEKFTEALWLWEKPEPIPWMTESGGETQLVEPTELSLIRQILAVVEDLEKVKAQNYIQLGRQLGQAWLEFERNCRIWGQVKTEKAQARLGLIALTQSVLRWLIQDWMGVLPLTEL